MGFNTVDIMGNELTKFRCIVCLREYLPASEFSEPQIRKCEEQEIRNTAEHTIRLLEATCKVCQAQDKGAELARATERAAKATEVAAESLWDQVEVNLSTKPFGLSAAPTDVGYHVARASEGKPAHKNGIRAGWVLRAIDTQNVQELPLSDVQTMLKTAELPLRLIFSRPPADWHFCVGCLRAHPPCAYSRKMLTKPVDKRRCSACVLSGDSAAPPSR